MSNRLTKASSSARVSCLEFVSVLKRLVAAVATQSQDSASEEETLVAQTSASLLAHPPPYAEASEAVKENQGMASSTASSPSRKLKFKSLNSPLAKHLKGMEQMSRDTKVHHDPRRSTPRGLSTSTHRQPSSDTSTCLRHCTDSHYGLFLFTLLHFPPDPVTTPHGPVEWRCKFSTPAYNDVVQIFEGQREYFTEAARCIAEQQWGRDAATQNAECPSESEKEPAVVTLSSARNDSLVEGVNVSLPLKGEAEEQEVHSEDDVASTEQAAVTALAFRTPAQVSLWLLTITYAVWFFPRDYSAWEERLCVVLNPQKMLLIVGHSLCSTASCASPTSVADGLPANVATRGSGLPDVLPETSVRLVELAQEKPAPECNAFADQGLIDASVESTVHTGTEGAKSETDSDWTDEEEEQQPPGAAHDKDESIDASTEEEHQMMYQELLRFWMPKYDDIIRIISTSSFTPVSSWPCYSVWRAIKWELDATEAILQLDPKNYQVWNHRFSLFTHAVLRTKPEMIRFHKAQEVRKKGGLSEDEEDDNNFYGSKREHWDTYLQACHHPLMQFNRDFNERELISLVLLRTNAKNYHAWFYRHSILRLFPFWIERSCSVEELEMFLLGALRNPSNTTPETVADWGSESSVSLTQVLPVCTLQEEFDFCHSLLALDVFNNSAWCHRYNVFAFHLVEDLLRELHHSLCSIIQKHQRDALMTETRSLEKAVLLEALNHRVHTFRRVIAMLCQRELVYTFKHYEQDFINESPLSHMRGVATLFQTVEIRLQTCLAGHDEVLRYEAHTAHQSQDRTLAERKIEEMLKDLWSGLLAAHLPVEAASSPSSRNAFPCLATASGTAASAPCACALAKGVASSVEFLGRTGSAVRHSPNALYSRALMEARMAGSPFGAADSGVGAEDDSEEDAFGLDHRSSHQCENHDREGVLRRSSRLLSTLSLGSLPWGVYVHSFDLLFTLLHRLTDEVVPQMEQQQRACVDKMQTVLKLKRQIQQRTADLLQSGQSHDAVTADPELVTLGAHVEGIRDSLQCHMRVDSVFYQSEAARYQILYHFLEQTWRVYLTTEEQQHVEAARPATLYAREGVRSDFLCATMEDETEEQVESELESCFVTGMCERLFPRGGAADALRSSTPSSKIGFFLRQEATALLLAKQLLQLDPIRRKYWRNEIRQILLRQYGEHY